MTKEMMKSLCIMNTAARKEGCIGWYDKEIQLTTEAFRSMFKQWEFKKHSEEYVCCYVIEDGFEFFCLTRF